MMSSTFLYDHNDILFDKLSQVNQIILSAGFIVGWHSFLHPISFFPPLIVRFLQKCCKFAFCIKNICYGNSK